MQGAQGSKTNEGVAEQWWQNFQRGYYKCTACPYPSFVWEAAERYGRLLRDGASSKELEGARESLMHYWKEWKLSAIEHVQDGLRLFLDLTKVEP